MEKAELVAGYSETELAVIAGAFEKFTALWQQETVKAREGGWAPNG
ncbi:MAG TPA: hypothetical protein PKD55_19460 [Bellilinea sp.]|nr:hypothetical protein [Bellilinea sp.]